MLSIFAQRFAGAHEDDCAGDQDVAAGEGMLSDLGGRDAMRIAHRLQRDASAPERRDERGLDEVVERKRRPIRAIGGALQERRSQHVAIPVTEVEAAHELSLRAPIARDVSQRVQRDR